MTDYELPHNLLPHDKASEQAVLGAVILYNEGFAEVRAALPREAFYSPAHKIIYEAMCQLADKEQPIDEVTIGTIIKQRGAIETTGGVAYLGELTRSTPVVDNVSYYSGIVSECWKKREIIRFFDQTRQSLEHSSISNLISQARDFFETLSKGGDRQLSVDFETSILSCIDDMDARCRGESKQVGFKTGLPSLDALIGGLTPSCTYVIAARPSVGKSALALNLALRMCGMIPNPDMPEPALVLFMSLEMRNLETAARGLSVLGGIGHDLIKDPTQMQAEDWNRMTLATSKIMGRQSFFVSDVAGLTVQQIESEVQKLHSVAKARFGGRMVVFIDYLQLIETENKGRKREDQLITEITVALKRLAMRLNVAVVELAQLNRNLETRVDKRPILSDLRGSGSIEQDSNTIMALYRPSIYNEDFPDSQCEILVIKNRDGRNGTAELFFDAERQTFREYRPGEHPVADNRSDCGEDKPRKWRK